MVRMWGNIPLFTEPVNENRPQSDPDEVYNVIFSDLLYAVNNIPASAYPKSAAASNDGHITKYAASALLARVYLFYTGYYGKEPQVEGVTKSTVLQGLEDFIAVAESEGYGLVDEFKNLWPAASTTWALNKSTDDYEQTSTYAATVIKKLFWHRSLTILKTITETMMVTAGWLTWDYVTIWDMHLTEEAGEDVQ